MDYDMEVSTTSSKSAGDTHAAARYGSFQAPSACPFSGVAIDPAMWESIQAKLGGKNHHSSHMKGTNKKEADRAFRTIVQRAEREDCQTSLSSRSQSPARRFVRRTQTNNYRVRVINQTTQRFKDLVLDRKGNYKLFDAIYNHPSVLEAQVREWGSAIAEQVEIGQSQIMLHVMGGDDAFSRWFSINELKQVTTKQLYRQIEELASLDSVVIYLVCVPKGASTEDFGTDAPGIQLPEASSGKTPEVDKVPEEGSTILPGLLRNNTTSTFRVRVVNETTKRSKDMVLDKNDKDNLFDAIYNHPSVKAAHIRKWGSAIARDVKRGQSEIKVKVVVGGKIFCRWLAVEDLTKTTVNELYQLNEEYHAEDAIVLYLVCFPKGGALGPSANVVAAIAEDFPPQNQVCARKGSRHVGVAPSTSIDALEKDKLAPVTALNAARGPDQEKSFKAAHPTYEAERAKVEAPTVVLEGELLRQLTTTESNRQPMTFSSFRRQSTNTSMVPFQRSNSTEESRSLCLQEDASYAMLTRSSMVDSSMSDPCLSNSMMDMDSHSPLHAHLDHLQDKIKTTLGVRVINQTTKRHKDLVIDISDSDTVFDRVYDHPGVKAAHVRKWGGTIARAVKAGTSEIKFSVWDDDTQKPWRMFSIDELKFTTTRQLYEFVSESSNLIKIYLQCVSASDESSTSNAMAASSTSANVSASNCLSAVFKSCTSPQPTNATKIRNTSNSEPKKVEGLSKSCGELNLPNKYASPKPHAPFRRAQTLTPRRQASLRLEKHGRPRFSFGAPTSPEKDGEQPPVIKRTIRPNHMSLSAPKGSRIGSCPTMVELLAVKDSGAMQRRTDSHDRLNGLLKDPVNSKDRQGLLAVASSSSEPVGLDPIAEPPRTMERKEEHQHHAGSKNEGSKNATWQSRKTGRHERNTAADKLFSRLKNSAFVSILPLDQRQTTDEGGQREVPNELLSHRNQSAPPTTKTQYSTPLSDGVDSNECTKRTPERILDPNSGDALRRSLPKRNRSKSMGLPGDHALPLFLATGSGSSASLKSSGSDPDFSSSNIQKMSAKLREVTRLIRAKKSPEFQSQRCLFTKSRNLAVVDPDLCESRSSAPSVVQLIKQSVSSLGPSVNALTSQGKESVCSPITPRAVQTLVDNNINSSVRLSPTQPTGKSKTSDKIARFLTLQKSGAPGNEENSEKSKKLLTSEPDEMDCSVSMSTRKSLQNQYGKSLSCSSGFSASRKVDMPPMKEISVIANDIHIPSVSVGVPGVALSPDVVKEVFPYHVVVDVDFRIIQVGNSLETLMQEAGLIGRYINDIMTVTSPIPIFGRWDWSVLAKMTEKMIFLESVPSPAIEEKVKLKGTLIEVSKSPKQVMLALFPNVKNLAELEEASLTMADLPLHSCQREAVLLGEHSKSEVNLTNHLDKLHRELIDSMEQQIKDRTEELAAANRSLEKANSLLAIQSARQLEHFACMSHEIRTPLNCIVGMSSLLLDDADDMDPMHADSIRMINTSGDLLKAVVDDVLDYAKLESGSFEVDIKETNLQHTLNSVAHSISQKVQEKNIRLRLDYSPFLPELVETDSRRLQQVLFNLLGNAGKFSKENSVIDLTVSVVPVDGTEVDHRETSEGKVIRFAVKDYGKGIEEKDFKTIFEPFSQASKETQTVYGGTGLGLSITSKLVHRLGGTVSLKSEYGKYTEFTVDLPLRGNEVNVSRLQRRLRDTSLVVLEPPKTYDDSVAEYAIKPEPVPFQAIVAEAYNLNVMRCGSIEDVFESLEKADGLRKHFAFLVHEDLYELGLFDRLDKVVGPLNYTLLTFGPNYSVEMTKDRHLKSLSGVFPSALLETVATTMELRAVENRLSNRILVSPVAAEEMQQETGLDEPMESEERGKPTALFAGNDPKVAPMTETGPKERASGLLAGNHGTGGLFSISHNNRAPPMAVPPNETSAQSMPQSSVVPPPSNHIKGKHPSHSAARHALKVLYAEDNKINQKVLTRVLTRSGITNLTIVDDGKKAVDITEREKFDIIFMDVQMPVMDGLEATQLIMERNPSEKVVFVTAHALDEFKAQAEAVRATGFLSKPFRLEDIEKVLDDLGHSNLSADVEISSPPATLDKIQASGTSTNDGSGGLFTISQSKLAHTMAMSPKGPSLQSMPLPSVRPHSNHKKEKEKNHSAARLALKVLYAEDNKINQKVLTRVLTRSGITNVTIVDDGKKAVDITEREKFDIIFMDVQMPVMGGMEATQFIMERNPSEKVVFVTAHALDEFKAQGKGVGASSFISKPFRLEDIEKVLKDLGY